ncbi:MAG: monovalent cation/H(+) antiporter subunit G [candidate division WOR-3 bacterium]|nr:monovalent cation/H(+) antiporter subunit G [candidate division WOR-3 bacterium]MDW8113826.1 monovalent cation/H(+) antiporter subunit G [candidate division WOR-3 bacterium]
MIFYYLGWISIIFGVIFNLLGALGLVKFPDLYNRMQASTKCVTIGTCGIMLGIFFIRGFNQMGIKALICALFILFTMPVAAHALSRGSLLFGTKLWHKSVIDKFGEDKKGYSQISKEDEAT